jgi:hypothetical protein
VCLREGGRQRERDREGGIQRETETERKRDEAEMTMRLRGGKTTKRSPKLLKIPGSRTTHGCRTFYVRNQGMFVIS